MRLSSLRCSILLAAACSLDLRVAAAFPPQQPSRAQADSSHGSLRGRVVDATGAPVGRAVVIAVSTRTADARQTATDARGEFTLVLEPGSYRLRAIAHGFSEAARDVALAGSAATLVPDLVLQVAGVRETVSVHAPAGYGVAAIGSATKTPTPVRDVPQSVTVVTKDLVHDQMMLSVADVVRYIPGIGAHQGENNRDDVVIRGNRSSADFFLNGVRDDVQYFRDLYNVDRIEALKGPNALIFGRGGGGGVVNRVVKEALFQPVRDLSIQAGAHGYKRMTADFGFPLGAKVAVRVNGMFEDSGSFRDHVMLDRAAVNPTLTYSPGARTRLTLAYEYLRDTRVADRGITSFQGRPAAVGVSTFYGNPDDSEVRARVQLGSALMEHQIGGATIRNRTLLGDYSRFYQNYVPGAATADRAQVTLTAYNNAGDRVNVFNQTDVTYVASTAGIRHTLLAGAEIGRQRTGNFRMSGFFDGARTSILVPFDNPTVRTPVTFRQNATDADNEVRARVAAAFAQDQIELSRRVQVIGGIRVDRFDLQYDNHRTGDSLGRTDHLVSPRAGVVYKPAGPLSLYGSYSVSFLPSAGDQFSSLTAVTQQMKPERFDNYEVGIKWEARPALAVTGAVYRLDRTNTRATDPNDPARIVQTGSQRSNGVEIEVNGQVTRGWKVAGGYAYQDAFVTRATAAARAGAEAAQVPHHAFSLWNHVQFTSRAGAALGVVRRSAMFATIDNSVTLPEYTRADLAFYVALHSQLRLQVNVENAFDARYFANADSNTNISPGAPRALRVGLSATF